MDKSRREFIKKTAFGAAGLGLGSLATGARAYSNIPGANERMNFGVVGTHSRGIAHIKAIAALPNTSIGYVCDVDSRVVEKTVKLVEEITGKKPKAYTDIRKMLEEKDLDTITIATPEHWHAPMTLMGVQAGKHVYIEKPCSHNPYEGELLVQAQKKYGKVIQMGNQQRSAPTSQQAIQDIKDGIIGKAYFGKAWYANRRGPIGTGQRVPVPEWLNWELWQGPAPRQDYQDIWVHYNWHWFWEYGTGEINNNGTHEIDICRWALGVDFPTKVTSSGGRYHYNDDWEFYDTQEVNYEFPENKMITWEGRSCNNFPIHNRGRGATIHGTEGTVLLDRNNYIVYNKAGEEIKKLTEDDISATTDTRGEGGLDIKHMRNFINAIHGTEKQNSPIDEGAITNLLCHLGNISQAVGRTLHIDKMNGHILADAQAQQFWSREYEPGWEPRV